MALTCHLGTPEAPPPTSQPWQSWPVDGHADQVGPRGSPAVTSPGWPPGAGSLRTALSSPDSWATGGLPLARPPSVAVLWDLAGASVTSLWGSCPLFLPCLGRRCWCSKQIKTCLQGPSAPHVARPRAGLLPRISLKL